MDDSVGYLSRVGYLHPVTYLSLLWQPVFGVAYSHGSQPLPHLLFVRKGCHESCRLGGQAVVEHHVAAAGLIEYGHYVALSVGGTLGCGHCTYAGYDAFLAYCVAADVASYVLNEAVVAHRNVA